MQAGMGVFALVVDAKDAVAASFYQYHGFTALTSNPLTLVLPIAALAKKNQFSKGPHDRARTGGKQLDICAISGPSPNTRPR